MPQVIDNSVAFKYFDVRPKGSLFYLPPCRECGGAAKVIACIEDLMVIEKILAHMYK